MSGSIHLITNVHSKLTVLPPDWFTAAQESTNQTSWPFTCCNCSD